MQSRCLSCLAQSPGDAESCPACGERDLVRATKAGAVVELPVAVGVACATCGEVGLELKFRQYRRVIGMFIVDRVYRVAGYMCEDCRRYQFRRHMGLTLLLGWWGVLAALFRNPYAIAVNVGAVFRAPPSPERLGAIRLDALFGSPDGEAGLAGGASDAMTSTQPEDLPPHLRDR